jgi:hypothetical protein
MNSLSALEAGKIDEILQKANEAREGGISGGIGAGPVDVSGGKKKSSNIEEQLVRTRTVFSAFDEWYKHLNNGDALGTFDKWDLEVRNDLATGDTLQFEARLTLTPVHRILRTFISFADQAQIPGSVFQQKGEQLNETKKVARMMELWLGGKDAPHHFPVYMAPYESAKPVIIARLDEEYMLRPKEGIDGLYKVIAQVDEMLRPGDEISAFRIIRDVPPTPMEVKTISDALTNFIEPAKDLGVTIAPADISVAHPAILLRPIAVYR